MVKQPTCQVDFSMFAVIVLMSPPRLTLSNWGNIMIMITITDSKDDIGKISFKRFVAFYLFKFILVF
jgi:hypothetical protein